MTSLHFRKEYITIGLIQLCDELEYLPDVLTASVVFFFYFVCNLMFKEIYLCIVRMFSNSLN